MFHLALESNRSKPPLPAPCSCAFVCRCLRPLLSSARTSSCASFKSVPVKEGNRRGLAVVKCVMKCVRDGAALERRRIDGVSHFQSNTAQHAKARIMCADRAASARGAQPVRVSPTVSTPWRPEVLNLSAIRRTIPNNAAVMRLILRVG